MSTYANRTEVPVEKTRAEIERTLTRYGATSFAYGWSGERATIGFVASGRQIRFVIQLPDRNDRRFQYHSRGRRTPDAALREWEQACRQRWRALALVIKAKLEAIEAGISEFDHEFLAWVVLPDGSTVGDVIGPQLTAAYESGTMPPLLALGPGEVS